MGSVVGGKNKYHPSLQLKIIIMGSVEMKSSGGVTWSVNDESLSSPQCDHLSLSPLSRTFPSSLSGLPNVISLVIVGHSLPQQSTFIFTLSCLLEDGYSSSTSVSTSMTTHSPPFGGGLEVK
jgi:hypothetical protein